MLEVARLEDARVLRGGSWNNNEPANLLSSYRNNNTPDNRNNNNGFRVVLSDDEFSRSRYRVMARFRWAGRRGGPVPRSRLTGLSTPRRSRGQDAVAAVDSRPWVGAELHGGFSSKNGV